MSMVLLGEVSRLWVSKEPVRSNVAVALEDMKRKFLAAMPLPTPRTADMEEDADAAERRRSRDAALVANISSQWSSLIVCRNGSKIHHCRLSLPAGGRRADRRWKELRGRGGKISARKYLWRAELKDPRFWREKIQ